MRFERVIAANASGMPDARATRARIEARTSTSRSGVFAAPERHDDNMNRRVTFGAHSMARET